LTLPPSPVCTVHPDPSAVCPFQFLDFYPVFSFFFDMVGVRLSRRLCWFIPGVAVGVLCATYLLTCWSVSPNEVWILCLAAKEPSSFLSATWHEEALYRLGVRSVRVLLLLGFFLPSVAPESHQDFSLTGLMLSISSLLLPSWIFPNMFQD
jgi:hypothetical protein